MVTFFWLMLMSLTLAKKLVNISKKNSHKPQTPVLSFSEIKHLAREFSCLKH